MSRQNKANPARFTQRGRLTQDDAARELRKQSVIGSPQAWQPANTRTRPWPTPAGDAARATETSADNETMVETSPHVERRPATRTTKKVTATTAALSKAKSTAAKAKTATIRKSKRTIGTAKTGKAKTGKAKTGKATTGKAKTGKAVATAKRTTTKPRSTTKRRKS